VTTAGPSYWRDGKGNRSRFYRSRVADQFAPQFTGNRERCYPHPATRYG